MADRVSIAELAAAGFVLHSAEAAAIVVEVCRQYERGLIRGIPSTYVIRLTPDGEVVAEGPVTTDHPPIAKAAQLLNDLLPPFDAPPPFRVPGGLRLVVARALGTLDLPPFPSLEEFCTATARFAADDLASTARNLYCAWEIARTPRTLTISDLRRARRATGLSLADISSACGVSAGLLRELEWGYLKNWRNDAVGRSWLSGYAKASGLDEQLVTSIVVPMLEEADEQTEDSWERARIPETAALVPSGPQELAPVSALQAVPRQRWSMVWTGVSAAAIVVLTAIALTVWPRPAMQARNETNETTAPALVAEPAVRHAVSEAPPAQADEARVVPAVQTRTAEKPAVTKAHTTARRSGGRSDRKPASKPNFFKRQLLRIVIK